MAVKDASVQVYSINPDGSIITRYPYYHSKLGTYLPVEEDIVKPEQWYHLHVILANGDTLKAKTFVPGDFKIVNQPAGIYTYQSKQKIEIVSIPSKYPNRQTYYLFTTEAMNKSEDNLTPYFEYLVSEKGLWINTYFIHSSEITNEQKYEIDPNGNIILELPWSAFTFYGTNKITVNAIDDNIYDYIRSFDGITDSTTLETGEAQNIRYNVEGGIGIFESMSSDTTLVSILKAKKQQ